MKLNTIHDDLKESYSSIKQIKSRLTYEFTVEDETKRVIEIFKKGYWSVMPFAFGTYDNFGIRLDPKCQVKKSSIVSMNRSDAITVASNLETFLPLISLRYIDDIEIIKALYVDKWDEIVEASFPYREYTGSLDSLGFLKDFIHNPDNLKLIEKSNKNFDQIYLDFWNHYNDTPEQKVYTNLITKLVTDKDFLPKYEEIDYGIWNNRAYSALGQKSYRDLEAIFGNVEKYYWKKIIQPHGFDSVDLSFGVVPNQSSDSYLSLRGVLNQFDTHPDLKRVFSKEITDHPLFDALQDLRVKKKGYLGEKHVEVAALLDVNYDDPYAAWDALVTGSYWAGRNRSKAIEPMWEAAIYLSEKHNWTEIHEILVQQYEYYNFYKDKV